MGKREDKQHMDIAQSVLHSLPDDKLIEAKKFLDRLAKYKKLDKLYKTYIVGTEQSLINTGNGKIYSTYNMAGAVTGRLSNSGINVRKGGGKEGKLGVSFHTLSREDEDLDVNIRDCFVAPPGWRFITVDKQAMEVRVLAHVAKEKNLIKAFEEGKDLHTFSAGMTFNKPEADVTKEERQISKAVTFLTVYGGTHFTLAAKQNISEERAEAIIASWMSAFPGVEDYMDEVLSYLTHHKFVKTIFGRRRHLPNIDSPIKGVRKRAFRQGLNFTIQSTASDILLCAIMGLNNRIKVEGLQAKIIATVHDSIELICPDHELDRVIVCIKDELINYHYMKKHFGIYLRVPMAIDIEVGTSFGNGVRVT